MFVAFRKTFDQADLVIDRKPQQLSREILAEKLMKKSAAKNRSLGRDRNIAYA
jgi:hypothetical protein